MDTDAYEKRQHWLWVTRPEFYLDENGDERDDLDPSIAPDSDGWWTCHKDTHKGDFVLLYRTAPKSDIAYLMQATSDAYSIVADPLAQERSWPYGCEYQVLHKLVKPVTISQLKDHDRLREWSPLRGNFEHGSFRIQTDDWVRLARLAGENDPAFAAVLERNEGVAVTQRVIDEEALETALVNDLGRLKPFGYDLELYTDPVTGASGRQFFCKGNGGFVDLLCVDRSDGHFVVLELKVVMASTATFAQICNYVGFVKQNLSQDRGVIGVVISRGKDVKFEAASMVTDSVFQVDEKDLGFELQ